MAVANEYSKSFESSQESKKLLERANEFREMATKFHNTQTRERMLKVAADYEQMAMKSAARELEIAELEELVRNAQPRPDQGGIS